MRNLFDGEYYWVKYKETTAWEIGNYHEDEDMFYFTNFSSGFREDCFKISYNPIEHIT